MVIFFNLFVMIPENNKTMPFFKFENLRLYYKALDFSDSILALASNHSDSSDAHFFNRFSDEALNVVMTIADGGAEGKNEFISQLQNTKSSIRNCVVFNTLAGNRLLIDPEQENDIRNELMELTKMVGALITSLKRQEPMQEENLDF